MNLIICLFFITITALAYGYSVYKGCPILSICLLILNILVYYIYLYNL